MYKKVLTSFIILIGFSLFLNAQIQWTEDSPTGTGSYNAIAIGDFNRDGLKDIAGAPAGGGMVIWYKTLTGWNSVPEVLPTSQIFNALHISDIDDNGWVDVAGSGDNLIEVWLYKYNRVEGTHNWISGNNFDITPTGLFNDIRINDINIVEEKYQCGAFTPNACQTAYPRGLDLVLTDNSGGGHGIKTYKWAGYVGTPPNCEGSWKLESVLGLPGTNNYSQIALKDLNNDGAPDIIATKNGGIDVYFRVYVHDPAGCLFPDKNDTLGARWSLQNGQLPYSNLLPFQGDFKSVAVKDIDEDGYPDIIAIGDPVENLLNSGMEIWYGKPPLYEPGATQWLWDKEINIFDPYRYLLIQGVFLSMVTDDFNGDDIIDIAALGVTAPIYVWKGDYFTSGNYNIPQTFYWEAETAPTSSGSYSMIAHTDFNRDGKKDIALASNNNNGIRVFLRTSPDVLSPRTWYSDIDINDFTSGFGKEPFPMVRFSGAGFYGGEGGTVGATPEFMGHPEPTTAWLVATVENDPTPTANDIRLYKSNGKGQWFPQTPPTADGAFESAALDYINNDELLDLAAVQLTSAGQQNGIKVWLQYPQAGMWTDISTGLVADGHYFGISFGDINGDKFKDIIAGKTTANGETGGVEIWIGSPDSSTLWHWTSYPFQPQAACPFKSVTTGDFNNDGLTDIAACCALPGGSLMIFYNNASGWTEESIIQNIDCSKLVAAYVKKNALTRDNWLDLVVTTANGILVYTHKFQGNSSQWTLDAQLGIGESFTGVVASDVNGDGFTDIVAQQTSQNTSSRSLRTWYGLAGEWAEQPKSNIDYTCMDLASIDINQDHFPDLAGACDSPAGDHLLRVFYLYERPDIPVPINPPDGQTITTTRQPQFQLSGTSNYSNCLRYRIEIADNPGFDPMGEIYESFKDPHGWSNICYNSGDTATYNLQVTDNFPGGLPDGTYFWRPLTYDGFKFSQYPVIRQFTIDPIDKIPPAETYNLYMSKVLYGVRLTWNRSAESDVNRYRIFRGAIPNFSVLPSAMINELDCPCTNPVTYDDTTFTGLIAYYKIKAVDTTGNQGP